MTRAQVWGSRCDSEESLNFEGSLYKVPLQQMTAENVYEWRVVAEESPYARGRLS